MKTIEINLYTVNELSNHALERAHYDFVKTGMATDFLYSERNGLMKNFEYFFNVSIRYNGNFCKIDTENELSGNRLRTYIVNNYLDNLYRPKRFGKRISNISVELMECPISGLYWDFAVLQPLFNFICAPSDITYGELIKKCLLRFDEVFEQEVEYRESLEYFIEYCNENNYLFLKNGDLYNENL